jgi:hypothetical protein
MIKIFKVSALIIVSSILFSFDLPEGWFKAGANPDSYDMGIDKGAGQNGKNAATIKSLSNKRKKWGTLMQNSLPTKYLGKKIKMSGFMKSANVSDWAGFWLRVDGSENKWNSLSFDNMYDRAIKGTTDWKKYEIVLNVPNTTTNIAFGALLNGPGQIWFENLNFEIVDDLVKTTGTATHQEPFNLDFSK